MKKHILYLLLTLMNISAQAAAPVIDFVTPTIARVRWTPDGTVTDNATGVCVYKKYPVDLSTLDPSKFLLDD